MSASPKSPTKVPEFVYANNGAKYHPCLYCCRAFAHKRYLSLHMKACVRTHLTEGDRKASVSFFPSNGPKQEPANLSRDISLGVSLPQGVTVTSSSTVESNNVRRAVAKPKKSSGEDGDSPEPTLKKLRSGDGAGDVNDNEYGNVEREVRKFSMENACKLCDEIFSSLDELIMHAKIEHNQRSKDNKKFSPEDIEYFLKVFIKMNKSHCPICRKAILNTLNWRGHLYTHCTVRKFVCKICGKSFTRSDHCKHHELRHKHGSPTEEKEEEEEEEEDEAIGEDEEGENEGE